MERRRICSMWSFSTNDCCNTERTDQRRNGAHPGSRVRAFFRIGSVARVPAYPRVLSGVRERSSADVEEKTEHAGTVGCVPRGEPAGNPQRIRLV